MKTLSKIIHGGWHEHIKDLPVDVRTYWSFRDELSMQNGIILKGNQVIIPDQLRHNILEQLYASHQGVEKTKRLLGNVCFDLACQNQFPWVTVRSDIFTIGSNNFLIISDYYSRFPVVK